MITSVYDIKLSGEICKCTVQRQTCSTLIQFYQNSEKLQLCKSKERVSKKTGYSARTLYQFLFIILDSYKNIQGHINKTGTPLPIELEDC